MKNIIKKLLCLSLVAVMLFPAFGCNTKDPAADGESDGASEDIFEITKELLSSYSIIIPENCSDELEKIANTLKNDIKKATGAELKVRIDFIQENSTMFYESEHEILLGLVDRAESKEFHSGIKLEDSGYTVIGKKIVLAGHTDEAASRSVTYFLEDVLSRKSEPVMTSADTRIVYGVYNYSEILLNGVSLSEYKIVYPHSNLMNEKKVASELANRIADACGVIVPCASDNSVEPTAHEIQIGDTNRVTADMKSQRSKAGYSEKNYYLGCTDNGVWISGSSNLVLTVAANRFVELTSGKDGVGTIDVSEGKCHEYTTLSLNVLNYNVKYDLETNERDPEGVITTIKEASPDVFGTIETTDAWLAKLDSALEGYECFSGQKNQKREDGEYNAIYYNKDKFELVSGGTKWFSATPDRVSMYSGARHYMTYNYAELRHKESGVRFMFVVAHFEPYRTSSTNPNQTVNPKADDVRMAQAKQLKAFIEEQYLPVVIVGDFNDSPTAKSIKELISGQTVSYAMDIAKEQIKGSGGTLVSSDYKTRGSAIYDYVFVTAKIISVERYEIIDNKIGDRYPSDHLPVRATITVYQ